MPTDETFIGRVEPTAQRYGHNKTTEDVFNDPLRPLPYELCEALAGTEHLSKRYAKAFVYGYLEPSPTVVEENVESHGFKNKANFDSYVGESRYMVAQAIWIYELINAYPDFPENCSDCGNPLGGTWVGHPNWAEPGVLCQHRAEIDQD
jgi:hypothetical protein